MFLKTKSEDAMLVLKTTQSLPPPPTIKSSLQCGLQGFSRSVSIPRSSCTHLFSQSLHSPPHSLCWSHTASSTHLLQIKHAVTSGPLHLLLLLPGLLFPESKALSLTSFKFLRSSFSSLINC